MNHLTRKITSLFFILLWFIPLLLVLSFNIKHRAIRYKMNEKIDRQHLQKILIPENEVIWMDEDEIWLNNLMFDIRSSNLENGVYSFEGFFDNEETELVKQRNKSTEKTSKENNEEHTLFSQLFKWIETAYNPQKDPDIFDVDATMFNFFKTLSLTYLSQKVPTPPPRQPGMRALS